MAQWPFAMTSFIRVHGFALPCDHKFFTFVFKFKVNAVKRASIPVRGISVRMVVPVWQLVSTKTLLDVSTVHQDGVDCTARRGWTSVCWRRNDWGGRFA